MTFNLSPLATIRDMAMLRVLHRRVIGKGPLHFKGHFILRFGRRLEDPRATLKGPMVMKSLWRLVAIYNLLPRRCRETETVQDLQGQLQELVKQRMADGCADWAETFSPRNAVQKTSLLMNA